MKRLMRQAERKLRQGKDSRDVSDYVRSEESKAIHGRGHFSFKLLLWRNMSLNAVTTSQAPAFRLGTFFFRNFIIPQGLSSQSHQKTSECFCSSHFTERVAEFRTVPICEDLTLTFPRDKRVSALRDFSFSFALRFYK